MESLKTNVESEVVGEYPAFLVGGTEFRYVRFDAPDNVVAWRQYIKSGEHFERIGILKIERIQTDSLKALGIWDKLAKETQDNLLKTEDEVPENLQKAWKARKAKGPKYPGVPDNITCIECGKVQKMSPGAIVKTAEKWAVKNQLIPDTDKWIKQWKCQECHKTPRGRKPSHNLPPKIELVCIKKCGKKVVYPASVVAKTIAKKGITLDFYVKNFVCQGCCNTRGRKKKSK